MAQRHPCAHDFTRDLLHVMRRMYTLFNEINPVLFYGYTKRVLPGCNIRHESVLKTEKRLRNP